MSSNMASYKSVLLIGASGMLGRAVQEELITQKGNFSKLGVLTTSASSPDENKDAYWGSLEAKGVQIIKADFSNNYGLVKAFTGIILLHQPQSIKYSKSCYRMGCCDKRCWPATGQDTAAIN